MIFWAPRLSATMILSAVFMTKISTLFSLRPSLLLCDMAVDKLFSAFGINRRLTSDFFRAFLRMIPVFCTERGGMLKL